MSLLEISGVVAGANVSEASCSMSLELLSIFIGAEGTKAALAPAAK